MRKIKDKQIIILVGIGCIICIGCLIALILGTKYADPSSFLYHETIFFENGASLYNEREILQDIRSGTVDYFIESEPDTELNLPESDNFDNLFSDLELYEIAQAFFESKWDDNFEEWRLVEISYTLYNCEEGFNGPYSVKYLFEKKIRKNFKTYIDERKIIIAVWKNMVGWSDKIIDDDRLSSEIVFDNINIHANDVYNIVQENDGADVNSVLENNCENVFIYIYNNDDGWNVRYLDSFGDDFLDLKIDSDSGEVRK